MASTLRPQDAFDYAKHFVKDMTLEKVGPRVLDDVNKIMWMAAPWRWTVGSMPTVTLAASTQDYTITPPGDFLYLLQAYTTDGVTAPRHLRVEPTLPTTVGLVGQQSRVAINGTTLRISPVPANVTTPAPTLISLYKKQAPVITAQTMATAGTQVFDDEWFWVFQEGVLWRAYLYGDDSRAGSATVGANGQIQYNGQAGVFQAALNQMKQNEKLPILTEEKE